MPNANALEQVRAAIERFKEADNADRTTPWRVMTNDGRKNIGIESAEVCAMDTGGFAATVHITAWKQGHRDARPAANALVVCRNSAPPLIRLLGTMLAGDRFFAQEWDEALEMCAKDLSHDG